MTLEEFKSYLTKEEFEKFVVNYNNYPHNDITVEKHISRYLFVLLIGSSFDWDESPEGWDYWDKISLRMEPLK